jgi:hypothetical protein
MPSIETARLFIVERISDLSGEFGGIILKLKLFENSFINKKQNI